MKFKIDENIALRVQQFLQREGHDCHSVYDEGLEGAMDRSLAAVCRAEGRILMTLDLDFADILLHPPEKQPGVIVLRLPSQDGQQLVTRLDQALPRLAELKFPGRLVIIDPQNIRVR